MKSMLFLATLCLPSYAAGPTHGPAANGTDAVSQPALQREVLAKLEKAAKGVQALFQNLQRGDANTALFAQEVLRLQKLQTQAMEDAKKVSDAKDGALLLLMARADNLYLSMEYYRVKAARLGKLAQGPVGAALRDPLKKTGFFFGGSAAVAASEDKLAAFKKGQVFANLSPEALKDRSLLEGLQKASADSARDAFRQSSVSLKTALAPDEKSVKLFVHSALGDSQLVYRPGGRKNNPDFALIQELFVLEGLTSRTEPEYSPIADRFISSSAGEITERKGFDVEQYLSWLPLP